MMKLLLENTNLEKKVKILFSLLLLTFPFGAKLVPFSIGFMTLYPYLIILVTIFFIGLINYKLIKALPEKLFLLFLFVWTLYSVVYGLIVEGTSEAIVDIRSVGMMFLTCYVFIWVKNFIGFNEWRKILTFCIKSIFILFSLFALFELLLGVHFIGDFTDKILALPVSGYTYTPVFLYDNPNTFLVYILIVGNLLLLLDKGIRKKPYQVFLVLTLCFLYSQLASARLGVITTLIIFSMYILLYVPYMYESIKKMRERKMEFVFSIALLLMMVVVFFSNEKYYGPIWAQTIVENAGFDGENSRVSTQFNLKLKENKNPILGDKYVLRLTDVHHYNLDSLDDGYNSSKIRAGLIFNGYHLLKESMLFGVGPGQFRHKHLQKDVVFYTKTNISPHFWFVELISQFGLVIFIPFIGFLLWVFSVVYKKIKTNFFTCGLILIALLVYGITSLLPSSFLILDVNWVFLGILISFTTELSSVTKSNGLHE